MTGKNYTILRTVVTLFMIFFTNVAKSNYENVFFDHSIKNIKGENFSLSKYKHKVVLLVNVASYCGFTKQYNSLQKLWETYKGKNFIVLGVPSNSFGQEKSNNEEVKDFCKVNFNITFPMTSIYSVKGDNAQADRFSPRGKGVGFSYLELGVDFRMICFQVSRCCRRLPDAD